MADQLFDRVAQRAGEISVGETTFEFLQRGGRPEAAKVRDCIESWYHPIPKNKRIGLRKRLKAKDFHTFMGAYFELQLHNFLFAASLRVAIEPDFPGSSGTVDFRVFDAEQEFYLEATVCGLKKSFLNFSNNEYHAVRTLRETLIRDSLLHSDLHLESEGELKGTPGKTIITPFRQLLLDHSPQSVSSVITRYGPAYWTYHWRVPNPPIAKYSHEGWDLTGWLAPPMSSDGLGRVVGPGRSGVGDSTEAIRNSLDQKAKHWRQLKRSRCWEQRTPIFLIAINVCSPNLFDEQEICGAIFGSSPSTGQGLRRFSNYLRDVHGIIVVTNGTLGNESAAPVRLYRNGDCGIPDCLSFIERTQPFGDILRIPT